MSYEAEVSSKLDFYLSIDELYEALDELMIEYKKIKRKSKENFLESRI